MADPTATQAKDERLANVGIVRSLLLRPEIGALLGAFLIYLIFSLAAPEIFPTIKGAARFLDPTATLGIMAVAVALLMIGGEFDLSTGVMTGSTGLILATLRQRTASTLDGLVSVVACPVAGKSASPLDWTYGAPC